MDRSADIFRKDRIFGIGKYVSSTYRLEMQCYVIFILMHDAFFCDLN